MLIYQSRVLVMMNPLFHVKHKNVDRTIKNDFHSVLLLRFSGPLKPEKVPSEKRNRTTWPDADSTRVQLSGMRGYPRHLDHR